jgi:Rrf2 family iron-sulfur cluster assembly transcriptional regulator
MMLTTKGRYAVMALVDLTFHQDEQDAVSLASVAERQHIPLNYLEQIFSRLRKFGIVQSVKGPGGGYRLNKTAQEITIADILSASDESIRMVRCNNTPNQGCMKDRSQCLTHHLWDGLGLTIKNYLQSITLASVCQPKCTDNVLLVMEPVPSPMHQSHDVPLNKEESHHAS